MFVESMIQLLFQSLIAPLFQLGQHIIAFSWQAAIVFSAIVALAIGGVIALNHGTRAPRWIFVPVLLTHVQVFVRGQFGIYGWWVIAAVTVASIFWLVWKCRETPVAALLFAWFCTVYSFSTMLMIYTRAYA